MTKKPTLIVIGAVVVLLAIAWGVLYFTLPAQLSVTLPEGQQPAKEVSLKKGRRVTKITLGQTLQLRSGKYLVFAQADDGSTFEQFVRLWPSQKKAMAIRYAENDAPFAEQILNDPIIGLFPHYDTNFEIQSAVETDSSGPRVTKLTIRPYVIQSQQNSLEETRQLQESYINEALEWLKANKVPETIPKEIERPY